jgi:succinyl-CoA synthetase beta subunit
LVYYGKNMILTEVEAKRLLQAVGLVVPRGVLLGVEELKAVQKVSTGEERAVAVGGDSRLAALKYPVMVKAQVLHGNRAQQGLVIQANTELELHQVLKQLSDARDQFGQEITAVLIEEALAFSEQHYLSLSYDTRVRRVVARSSSQGGVGMDDRGNTLETVELSILSEPAEFAPQPDLLPVLQKVWRVFVEHDLTLLEINPLVKDEGQWVCLDAKLELEDVAGWRHPEWELYPGRSAAGGAPTPREEQAHAVSRSDHRGVAGESFFEFPGGEIGVMASGGGASTLAMDALLAEGLQPANYTEYSGNPTREKVAALARVVLSIPNLRGLYVVGSNANFTDIYETLAGVIDGFLESSYSAQPGFAVLVRRGGPRWEEAFAMVNERLAGTQVKLQLCGPDFPLVETARAMRVLLESTQTDTR